MAEKNEAKACSQWVMLAVSCVILLATFVRIFRNPVSRMLKAWNARFADRFAAKYNERMHNRKQELIFNGMSQMTKELGRPLRVLEIGAGTGANFAYYPDGTNVSCLDPATIFGDSLLKNAGRFPGIKLGEMHVGFAENMSMIESETIDAVVCTLVLCSANDVDKSLQEILRVLKPVSHSHLN